ncbi:MAG: ATP-dependent helicase, partial [Chloroflexota bacterium]
MDGAAIANADDLLSDLNQQQREAVTHAGSPLLVLAGPGSGKTRVLTRRIAYRVGSGVPANRLLAITFTNKAAREMRDRLPSVGATIGTFHAAGNSILRRHAHHLGYRRDFSVLSPREARRLLRRALEQTGTNLDAGKAAHAVGAFKNGAEPALIPGQTGISEEALQQIAHAYRKQLRAANAVDIDDLLYLSAYLLANDEHVRRFWHRTWPEILVDEYQDTGTLQNRWLRLLGGPMFAVGDEDQSIYGWRQADSHNVLRFTQDFPGARVMKLEENYRSVKHIVRAASSLIEHNKLRFEKHLYTSKPAGAMPVVYRAGDELEEAEWVAREICRLTGAGLSPRSIAILYRVNAQARALEDALARHSIPYQVLAGTGFYSLPEIRRVVAYLRLAADPGNDDALAVLLEAIPGVGPKRLDAMRSRAEERGQTLLRAVGEGGNTTLRSRLNGLLADLHTLLDMRESSAASILDRTIDIVDTGLAGTELQLETARENLAELRSLHLELERDRITLAQLIERLVLAEDPRRKSEGVNLLSLHAAKGLEFPVVFVTGVEEGLLPHRRSLGSDESIEEERRLL